ncbi:MAG: ankyrin repeat domain-containing protein [Thiotrichaceae bacterium]|nr:ankyrin repeat domain-containing protein [Thiotrichaceae bacterium]
MQINIIALLRHLLLLLLFLIPLKSVANDYQPSCSLKKNPAACAIEEFPPEDQFLLAISQGQLHHAKQLFSQYRIDINYRSLLPYIAEQTKVRADVDYPFMTGRNRYKFASGTAFDIALSQYNAAAVKWLLSQGASPAAGYFAHIINNATFTGVYPNRYLQLPYKDRIKIIAVGYVLEVAAHRNDVQAVAKLLSIEPRAIHYQGNIILPKAMEQGKWGVTHLILDRGRDVALLRNFLGLFQTALRSEPTQYTLLQKLLNHARQNKDFDFDSLVKTTIIKKDQQALRMLLNAGASLIPKRGPSPLYKALDDNNLVMAKMLLQLGANPNQNYSGKSLLLKALVHEKPNFVRLLLKYRAKTNESRPGKSNLAIALSKKNLIYAQMLIKAGANVNEVAGASYQKTTPLITAVEQVRPNLVKLLMKSGAKPNVAFGYERKTALHIAVKKSDMRLIRILLAAKASINVRNGDSETPFFLAVHHKNPQLVQFMLAYKPNLGIVNNSGQTVLQVAIAEQNLPIVRLLLNAGAPVNTNSQSTPLIDALLLRRPQMARLLINKGAQLNVVSNARETPLDIARKRGLVSTARFIEQKGGRTAQQIGANPEHVRVRPIHN